MTGDALLLQKWSKGKMKEKVNNQVLFDKVSTAAACSSFNTAVDMGAQGRLTLDMQAQSNVLLAAHRQGFLSLEGFDQPKCQNCEGLVLASTWDAVLCSCRAVG